MLIYGRSLLLSFKQVSSIQNPQCGKLFKLIHLQSTVSKTLSISSSFLIRSSCIEPKLFLELFSTLALIKVEILHSQFLPISKKCLYLVNQLVKTISNVKAGVFLPRNFMPKCGSRVQHGKLQHGVQSVGLTQAMIIWQMSVIL